MQVQSLHIKIDATVTAPVITAHHKYHLCMAIIKAVMAQPTQTIEAPHVQAISQQGQNQESLGTTQEQRILSYA